LQNALTGRMEMKSGSGTVTPYDRTTGNDVHARTSHERYVMRRIGLESREQKSTDLVFLIAHEILEFPFCILVDFVSKGRSG
jgi:hypothetical protein